MIVVYGIYRFAPRRLAFRNDFCLPCESPSVAVQIRSFYVAHLYWLPLLPLGLWKKWFCSACGRDPHQPIRTRRFFKVLLVLFLVLMSIPFWVETPRDVDAPTIWAIRLVMLGAVGGAIWWATRGHRAPPSLREGLARVTPYEARTCPLCGGQLFDNPRWHCSACGAERSEL